MGTTAQLVGKVTEGGVALEPRCQTLLLELVSVPLDKYADILDVLQLHRTGTRTRTHRALALALTLTRTLTTLTTLTLTRCSSCLAGPRPLPGSPWASSGRWRARWWSAC